jgi:hypothetical protein
MGNGIGTVQVKVSRHRVRVLGMGVTPSGQKFIRANTELSVKGISDPKFKSELATAITEMLGQSG